MSIRGQKAVKETLHDILEQEDKYKTPVNPEEVIFSLDIGTRSVIGVVGVEEDGIFNIIDVEIIGHKSRAMLDGQIHEISKVVEVIEVVKENLESRLGFELTNVSIAAAGRSLKTNSAIVDRKLQSGTIINQDMVNSLELEGIQIAYENLHKEAHDDISYYCIGHTVINYYLNGYVISDLVGHKGKIMSANVLATFLPHTVVDSLYTVMEKVGLKVTSLTLEPIAAINVSIPKDIRLLNLAMVDIGAGTSDIAITKDGTVTAYAMCSIAGDEITERIAQYYLLDFHTAERVKVELGTKDIIEFEDIMGLKTVIKSTEIIKILHPAVIHLADVISQKILDSNGKPPNAVFCIGGGSLTPGLTKVLAEKLDIPTERVGVRGTDIIKNVRFLDKKLSGPEAITPVGIAVTALTKRGHDFIKVKLNKKNIKLFNTNKVTVADALVAGGFTGEQLIPRMGESLTFELNRKKHIVKGGYGTPAQIYVNNKQCSIDKRIYDGDLIKIVTSQIGAPAKAYVEDFASISTPKEVVLNNNTLKITTKISLNGKHVDLKHEIKEGDRLVIEEINTIKDLVDICEIDLSRFYITVNCTKVEQDYIIKSGDIINTVLISESNVQNKSIDNGSKYKDSSNDEVNNTVNNSVKISTDKKESISKPIAAGTIYYNTGRKALADSNKNYITVNVNNNMIKLNGKSRYIFVDVLKYYEFDLSNPKNRVELRLNGTPASFTSAIEEGDNLEIFWA